MGKNLNTTSHEIEKGRLYLIERIVSPGDPNHKTAVETPTNHVAIIDCSGSMTSDLPRIREQLKKKLPKLLKDNDTLSMIWFSGKGEFGVLFEAEAVATLADLNDINKGIDRWLRPVGLTGFKEPLAEIEKLVGRVQKKNKNPFSLFFMSDGCDNQWPRADILKTVEKVAGSLSSATFVEYGYYADRPLLAAMAEKAGGTHIHADAFDKYEVTFESAMQKRPAAGKRIEIEIGGDPIGGFAWTFTRDGDLVTYDISTGKATVPEHTEDLYYLSPNVVGLAGGSLADRAEREANKTTRCAISPAHAAISLFAVRMKPDVVYPILKALGDVAFIDQFSTCFGKQKYSEFMEAAKVAAFDETKRFVKGRDPSRVPADDAFTVLDLLRTLSEDESARILLDHSEFKYSRISRGRVDVDENLTADEQLAVEVIRQQMAGEKSAKRLKELQTELDGILAAKRDALKFVADESPDGYPISNLVYNENRPNISIQVRKTGKVDLSSRPDHKKFKIPTSFDTYIFRNYAIVRDGLVNVEKLPVTISRQIYEELLKNGVEMTFTTKNGQATPFDLAQSGVPSPRDRDPVTVVINVKPLSIINRKMVKAVSAKEIIELEYELTCARAAQKVYKAYQAEMFPGVKMKSMKDEYGEEGAAWLTANGFTYNGFAPKMVQAESKDFIVGKELEIKLKGYSTLASVEKVKSKMGGKMNGPDSLMAKAITEVEDFVKKNPKNLHEKWLTGQTQAQIAKTRGLIYQTAQIKFSVIVGQVWFQEFPSLDENTLTVKINGQDITGACELREIEIKV